MSDKNSKKRKYVEILFERIRTQGFEMSDKCSYCEKHEFACVASSCSGRCAKYVAQRRKCDLSGPSPKEWESVAKEETRIRREKERIRAKKRALATARRELESKQREMEAKLLRLKRLEEVNDEKENTLKVRVAKMLRLGLKSFDELDALEKTEKREAARVATEATAEGEPSASSSSPSVIFDFFSPFASFWESLDVGGETPQATQGN